MRSVFERRREGFGGGGLRECFRAIHARRLRQVDAQFGEKVACQGEALRCRRSCAGVALNVVV